MGIFKKIFGFIAAISAAAVSSINGDFVTGFGILAAAFSSSTSFNTGK